MGATLQAAAVALAVKADPLKHLDSHEDCLHLAIFSGGDTDTIAAMAGNLSGAYLGAQAILKRWLARVKEETYSVGKVAQVARQLWKQPDS